jgi:hypothetical protein
MTEPRDPFGEAETRRVGEYKALLVAEPELLGTLNADARSGGFKQGTIQAWDEIPDVTTMEAPKVEWAVEGIIPRASVVLIAGEPGSYKSWLALSLLGAVTSGGRFLGRECRMGRVLYLDRENPLAVVRDRLGMLGVESLSNSRIWGNWLPDPPPLIGDGRLLQIAREFKPVIIFDSLIRFHGADENSATEMAKVMEHLRVLANVGATPVALHHRPKSETSRYRGSSDIAGGVDMAFSLSRDRKAGLLALECFKSRFVEEFSFTIRPELAERGEFVVTDAPAIVAAREDEERLAQVIRDKPGQTQADVVAASGIPRGRARSVLQQGEGRLWRSERSAHNAMRFFPLDVREIVEIEV